MSQPNESTIALGPSVDALTSGKLLFRRYCLQRELGRGGMGVVWLAADQTLDEMIALKFLPEVIARDAESLGALILEVKKTRKLVHRNIIRVHDLIEDGQFAAISMEYVDGGTLRDRRRSQPYGQPIGVFATQDLFPWVEQLCAAVDEAHLHALVVHRDLKPVNLLTTNSGVLKVTDFGLARSLAESIASFSGNVSGTPGFMSPQQARGIAPSASDDIYSIGATLFDLLTGKPPFFRGDSSVVIDQVKNAPPPSIAERRGELDIVDAPPVEQSWEDVISACLAKDPHLRPRTGSEIVSRIKGDGSGSGRNAVTVISLQQSTEPLVTIPILPEKTETERKAAQASQPLAQSANEFVNSPSTLGVPEAPGGKPLPVRDEGGLNAPHVESSHAPASPLPPSSKRTLAILLIALGCLLLVIIAFVILAALGYMTVVDAETDRPLGKREGISIHTERHTQGEGMTTYTNELASVPEGLKPHFSRFSFQYPNHFKVLPEASKFIKLEEQEDGLTLENFAVGYISVNSDTSNEQAYPLLMQQFSQQISQGFQEYQELGQFPETIGGVPGRGMRWKAVARNTPRGDVQFFGYVLLARKDIRSEGVAIMMVATNLDPEVKSPEDVGTKGDLARILPTFQLE